MRVRKTPQPTISENIQWLYKDSKFSYVTELLKYYLPSTDIKNFVIILDDVDSIKDWLSLENIIHEACIAWECIRNYPGKKYNVKLLICERPETHKELNVNADWMTAYIWENSMYLESAPPLYPIFKKRFECIVDSPDVKDLDKWNLAFDTLKKVAKSVATGNHDLITALNNNNVRASLHTVEQILSLGRWLERSYDNDYHFDTTSEQFIKKIDVMPILRSIGYQNMEIYIDHNESRITNLLHNEKDETADLMGAYVIKYFLENEPKVSHSIKSISIEKFHEQARYIFSPGKNIVDVLQSLVSYFIKRKLLLISPRE